MADLVNLIRGGLIELNHSTVEPFALDQANEAVRHAAAKAGPFRLTVSMP